MSAHRFLAIVVFAPALAMAQAPPAPAQGSSPAAGEKPATERSAAEAEEIRREVDAKVEAAKKELREEIRAQAATQSVAQSWQEEWVDEKRKLELLTLDGFFRVRPELFYNFDLRRSGEQGNLGSGQTAQSIFPLPYTGGHTLAGVNMRLRLEPTINISEEVRLRMQVDGLDNVLLGSTPEYAFSRSDRSDFPILSDTQVPPVSGLNAVRDSIALKRVFGEVTTPVGVVRFGRMGSQWGLGMVHNDGNCFECDYGNTVDRIQFVTQPLPGIFVTPMIDFNVEGPSTAKFGELGQPVDLAQSDDAHSYVLAIARRDTDQQVKAKLENNQTVLNGGIHLTYRTQKNDPLSWFRNPFTTEGGDQANYTYVTRNAWLVIPDLWARYEQKAFRIEVEAAARIGRIGSIGGLHGAQLDDQRGLSIVQFGAVAQGEYRLLDNKLKIRAEVGYASGDDAPGMGAFPSRKGNGPNDFTREGDLDGAQWNCEPTGTCGDDSIRNFTFNRDYRVDLILWRELIGTITDALYVKPSIDYELTDGLHLHGAFIYSRAMFAESTPSFSSATGATNDAGLGVELDGGATYETEDGFFATVQAGIMFPLGGFNNVALSGQTAASVESATSFRAALGVRF